MVIAEADGRACGAAMPDEIRHLDFIDALRGIAAAAVALIHISQAVEQLPAWIQRFAAYGQYGVQLFFLASALTLFLSLEQRSKKDRRPAVAFLIRRFFRIAPLFWAAILVYTAIHGLAPRYWSPQGISGWQIAATAGFMHGWTPASIDSVVPGGWSIAVEMNFYLLVPLLYRWIKNLRHAVMCFLITLVTGVVASLVVGRLLYGCMPPERQYLIGGFTYFWLPAQLPVFALGIVLYAVLGVRRQEAGPAEDRKWGALLLLLGGYVFTAFFWRSNLHILLPQQVMAGVSFFLLAWGLSLYPTALLVNPVTLYLGRISYSVYLCHFAVLDGTVWLLGRVPALSAASPATRFAAVLTLTGLGTLLIATLTYHGIEVPGRKLGKWVIRRWIERERVGGAAG